MMRLEHGRVRLALHQLRDGGGPQLLLLHELFGSGAAWNEVAAVWPGAVFALDFSGHGGSDWLPGGAYCAELLAADADTALVQIGPAVVAGAGLGAYVALLLAGARSDLVPGALLAAGRGLDGGGAVPRYDDPIAAEPDSQRTGDAGATDPMVSILEHDIRPVDYAAALAGNAPRLLLLEDGTARPPWWQALRQLPTVETVTATLANGLRQLARRTI